MCISNIAIQEHDIHFKAIAEALKRDRSSIYYYVKQHKNLYENWAEYRNNFTKLWGKLYEGSELRQLDPVQFKNILKDNNIKEIKTGIVQILISSGAMTHRFRTTYSDMCEQVEQIKAVFTDYEIKIDIKL